MSLFYEDMRIGREFTSGSRSLGQREIESFAKLTGDLNRLHTDQSYARTTVFGGTIAHGLLVLSVALGLWYETGLTRDSLVALLGVNRVSFRAPVRPGEEIKLLTRVRSRRLSASRRGTGIVTLHDVVKGRDGKTLLEFERVLLLKRKAEN